jgi:hypothetical protein
MATSREPDLPSTLPDAKGWVSDPATENLASLPPELPGPAPAAVPALPPIRPPLRGEARVMSDAELLEQRIEFLPAGRCCAGCRHLGEPIRIVDRHGAPRYRRQCPHCAAGFTAPDWPACGHYDGRSPRSRAMC